MLLDAATDQNPDQLRDGVPEQLTPEQRGVIAEQEPAYKRVMAKQKGGALLEETSLAKVARAIVDMWTDLDEIMQPRLVQWKVNALRRHGVPNVKAAVRKSGEWFVWKAPNVTSADSVPGFRKAADLCRKMVSMLFADPPAPEAVPPSGDDEDVASSEFATRALEDVQSESTLNEAGKGRRAFDRGCSYGSGFLWYRIKDAAGGLVAVRLRAGRDPTTGRRAERFEDAEIDPLTQIPWPEYTVRFVKRDGTLSDEETDGATRWAPGIRSKVTDGRSVRLLPANSEDLREAHTALIHEWITVGEAREDHEEALAGLPPEALDKLVSWAPDKWEQWSTGAEKLLRKSAKSRGDNRLISRLHYYREMCPAYPGGAHIVVLGGSLVADRDEWKRERNGENRRLLLPLTQYAQFSEGEENTYFTGLMQIIGPAEEIRNAVWAMVLDFIDRTANRKTFIPVGAPTKVSDLNQPGQRYIPMLAGGMPVNEEVAPLPQEVLEALDRNDAGMDNASGLQTLGTPEGLGGPGTTSGRHAYAQLSTVHTLLSEVAQNIETGYVRGCRVVMQMLQAFYKVEQRIQWTGDDGDYKERAWSGADFESTEDVRLRPGTLTGLSPAAKEAQAREYAQLGILQPHELRETIRSNLGGRLGLQDDKQLERIRRQINAHRAGPPQGWAPPTPPIDPATGGPMMQPDPTGTVMIPVPPPPDPTLAGIWMPVPSDILPEVAQLRMHEISNYMASKSYGNHPPAWRMAIDGEFERMRTAGAPPAPAPPGQPAGAAAPPAAAPAGGIMPEPGM